MANRNFSTVLKIGAVVALLYGFSFLIDKRTPPETPAQAPPPPPTAEEQKQLEDEQAGRLAIRVAKADVPRGLKDPESAEFRDLFAVKTPKGGYMVCGEINSKNSFGAKTGYSKFIYNTTLTIFEEQMPRATFVEAWNGSCLTWQRIASRPS